MTDQHREMTNYRRGLTDGYQSTVNGYRYMVIAEYHAGCVRGKQLRQAAREGRMPEGVYIDPQGEVQGANFPEMQAWTASEDRPNAD